MVLLKIGLNRLRFNAFSSLSEKCSYRHQSDYYFNLKSVYERTTSLKMMPPSVNIANRVRDSLNRQKDLAGDSSSSMSFNSRRISTPLCTVSPKKSNYFGRVRDAYQRLTPPATIVE